MFLPIVLPTRLIERRTRRQGAQELNIDCKVSDTWNESNANPCWVDSGVESIKKEDAIESERVQKPVVCFDLERDIYHNTSCTPGRDYGTGIVIWTHGENDV